MIFRVFIIGFMLLAMSCKPKPVSSVKNTAAIERVRAVHNHCKEKGLFLKKDMKNARMDFRLLFNLSDSTYFKDRIRASKYIDSSVMKDVDGTEVFCVSALDLISTAGMFVGEDQPLAMNTIDFVEKRIIDPSIASSDPKQTTTIDGSNNFITAFTFIVNGISEAVRAVIHSAIYLYLYHFLLF